MHNLALILAYLYPSASPLTDYIVVDFSDGNGPLLAQWSPELGERPTTEQLLAAEPMALFAQAEKRYSQAVQKHLDDTSNQYGYDNINSAVSYRGDPDPIFAAEGDAFFIWRSQVWIHCRALLTEIKAGNAVAPGEEALLASLPALNIVY